MSEEKFVAQYHLRYGRTMESVKRLIEAFFHSGKPTLSVKFVPNDASQALKELCELKIMKAAQGDTPEYRSRKGPAWEAAFKCFKEYDTINSATERAANKEKI